MSANRLRPAVGALSAILLCPVSVYLFNAWPHIAEKGTEVTPARFSAMRERWAAEGPDHYRLVAGYRYEVVGGCSEDVEVFNEIVIGVYRSDCGRSGILTVTKIFDMFSDFVGSESTRPVAANQCMYYYVTATFDSTTGYPLYLKSHTIWGPTRGLYFSFVQSISGFSCLMNLPPQLTATIEALTPLE